MSQSNKGEFFYVVGMDAVKESIVASIFDQQTDEDEVEIRAEMRKVRRRKILTALGLLRFPFSAIKTFIAHGIYGVRLRWVEYQDVIKGIKKPMRHCTGDLYVTKLYRVE